MKRYKLKKICKLVIGAILITSGLYSFSKIMTGQDLLRASTTNNAMNLLYEPVATHIPQPKETENKILPFYQVYEPRQIGSAVNLKKSNTSNITKIVLLWTSWHRQKKTISYYFFQPANKTFVTYKCPNTNCKVTFNRAYLHKADAVLFHLVDVKPSDLPQYRTADQVWILYNMEPPWFFIRHNYQDLKYMKHLFNWTMTYRSDADIVAKYGFITPSGRSTLSKFPKKTRNVAWLVSDCNTDSKREDYVKELSKHIDVDIYGKCGDKKCYPSQCATCYERISAEYKFYLSFENALCKDYVTEKFFNIFNYDIIPIVLGGANYSAIAPQRTFIDASMYPDPIDLAHNLLRISNNDSMYNQMLSKKRSFTSYLDPWKCRLCVALQNPQKREALSDVEDWWMKGCKAWDKTNFKFIDTKY